MMILALRLLFFKQFRQPARLNKLYSVIQKWIFYLWKSPGRSGFFLLGAANGLLPCGMVYLALAGALNTTQIISGVVFMAMFGLGTLPPLFSLGYFGSNIKLSFRNRIRQMTPYLILAMAVILIVRGLNLGIPFISPLLGAARSPAVICH
jgi:sulfite exporter TauE/SafE